MKGYIEWCGLFESGHTTIDEQHRNLVVIANRFHEQVGQGHDRQIIAETLLSLVEYAQKHFADEESVLRLLEYEGLEEHHAIHEQLAASATHMAKEFVKGRPATIEEVEEFILDWLVLHILVEDRKYMKLLR